jgi:hypothetical protein
MPHFEKPNQGKRLLAKSRRRWDKITMEQQRNWVWWWELDYTNSRKDQVEGFSEHDNKPSGFLKLTPLSPE